MKIWVTRARPSADATAERLAAMGHTPLVAPLLTVRSLPHPPFDLEGVGALAFTSANGVAAFAVSSRRRDLPVFAVGYATSAAAQAAGFDHTVGGPSDVKALAALVADTWTRGKGVVLCPGAAEPAGDLIGELTSAGVPARAVAVYETVQALSLPALAWGAETALVHSPKAARAMAALAPPDLAGRLDVLALSPACAEPLAHCGFRSLRSAAAPREGALLELLAISSSAPAPQPG